MTSRADSPRRRRGLILTLWLWLLAVLPLVIVATDVALVAGRASPEEPWVLRLASYVVMALLSLAAAAALCFKKLGIYGIYVVFASNIARMLLLERDHMAVRLGVTLGLGAAFGLLVSRVWKEFT